MSEEVRARRKKREGGGRKAEGNGDPMNQYIKYRRFSFRFPDIPRHSFFLKADTFLGLLLARPKRGRVVEDELEKLNRRHDTAPHAYCVKLNDFL